MEIREANASISDLKRWDAGKTAYTAQTISASDYYPFGLSMQGRTVTAEEYRYGFNGKENDGDFGRNMTDFGARVYDSAIGRFLTIDPKSHQNAT